MDRWDRTRYIEPEQARGMQILAAAVKRQRVRSGISQVQLAYWTSLHQSTISRLENGRLRSMRLRVLARVLGVLNLPPAYLELGEPAPPTRRLPRERAA